MTTLDGRRAAPRHDEQRRWWIAGSSASLLSTAMLAILGMRRTGHAGAGINGPSQWIWGPAAKYRARISWRHTAVGYVVHHACSLLWARVFFSRSVRAMADRRAPRAALISAVAAAVDYAVIPRRFTPGFEGRLSAPSIAWVYIAFATGLAIGDYASSRRSPAADAVVHEPAKQ